MKTTVVLSVMFSLLCASATAEESTPSSAARSAQPVEEVIVTGVRQRLYQAGALKDVIQKTEVVDADVIESRQAVNLSQAIAESPGVRVSNECSMCGVKRIMLNGMRGEHTTILTDGIPLHTMLAGYYAVDAIATTGIERIEVARGAGASLIAPEAIGGTLNVISAEPTYTGMEVDAMLEEDDGYLASFLGTYVSDDGATRASLVTQFDRHDKVDGDNNKVSEAPLQDNRSYIFRISSDLSDRDNLTFRAALIDSEIFGGPTSTDSIGEVRRGFDGIESPQLFVDDNVNKRFIGKPWETTEWIDTERVELSGSWLHEFNERFNTTVSVGYSEHEQDSFYEGFDYAAEDELLYLDVRGNFVLNEDHLLTFGIDSRDEEMRSDSVAGELSADYIEDSFDYQVNGIYLQDTWTVNDALEIALAVRVDNIEADFVAVEKPGTEIDETIVAPRLDALYRHNDMWASRFSAGRGYRAPLSFFETDHGILDAGDGFAIDIDELEESFSATYALSFEGERLTGTWSVAYTNVDHLASMDETDTGVPLLTQLDGDARVLSTDIAVGYQFTDALNVGLTVEHFDYDTAFESSYAIAPVEQRANLTIDYDRGPWSAYSTLAWVGSRDLSDYGYEGLDQIGGALKSTSAQSYWTMDVRVARDFGERFSAYVGAYNLFNETQARDMQSPLFFDNTGGYDVAYIYGPLRGREIYAGLKYTL